MLPSSSLRDYQQFPSRNNGNGGRRENYLTAAAGEHSACSRPESRERRRALGGADHDFPDGQRGEKEKTEERIEYVIGLKSILAMTDGEQLLLLSSMTPASNSSTQ